MLAGFPTPACFHKASVTLMPDRNRIKLTGPFLIWHIDLRLSVVTSVETRLPGWFILLPWIAFLPQKRHLIIFYVSLYSPSTILPDCAMRKFQRCHPIWHRRQIRW